MKPRMQSRKYYKCVKVLQAKVLWHNIVPMASFTEIEKIILEFTWNHKRPCMSKAILHKKNKAGGITLPDLKIYYKAMVLAVKQWNIVESSEISPHIYSQLIFEKCIKNTGNSLAVQWLGL